MASIEIDGKAFDAENGEMIIEVADRAGIHIPRFCYHKKLSVAANCRMCLVEVENGRKPVPACATPITAGMKVYTKSEEALRSQKAVMEFLLINHPLDCPICDQGGECELQDVSMGFGQSSSEYMESKRAVASDDLGSLIATEMTRCIHCTRCVRFGDEVAGLRELGATGRGEQVQIGTYVEHSMQSEVSANIIDLCPVGALTSKPSRFTARAWELSQHEGIAPHDCLGSNIYLHSRRNELMRVVPKEEESINETWLSDRDRFSYLGVHSPSRLKQPMIKREGRWETVDWQTALNFAADGLSRVIKEQGPEQVAAFASASASTEELYLLQKLMRALGVANLDHRLQQTDFRDQAGLPNQPKSSLHYAELENQSTILLLGCNLLREVPLAGVRLRKAARNGAAIFAINPVDYDYRCKLKQKRIVNPQEIPLQLASLLLAIVGEASRLPEAAQRLVLGLELDAETKTLAEALQTGPACIVSGALCENHPDAALIRSLISLIEQYSQAKWLRFTTGANSAGAWAAGMLPHRAAAGQALETAGLDLQAAISAKLKAYVLMAVDPAFDFANPALARQSMLAAEFVLALSSFADETLQDYADVILPMASFAESSGTYVNIDLNWQSTKGVIAAVGDSRPAWKILRVLGNLLHCCGFDYQSSEEVLAELKLAMDLAADKPYQAFYPEALPASYHGLIRVGEWPLYRSDALLRHSEALQRCASADQACIRMHPNTAKKMELGFDATVSQGDIEITLPLYQDERIAEDVVYLPNAMPESVDLGHSFSPITIKR